jgi:hypothetical protein
MFVVPPEGCKFESVGEARKVDCEKLECFAQCPEWSRDPGEEG